MIELRRKERRKTKTPNLLKISARIGDNPPEDQELAGRIAKLGKKAPLVEIFREVSKWENEVVHKDRQHENTKLTGKLVTTCRCR